MLHKPASIELQSATMECERDGKTLELLVAALSKQAFRSSRSRWMAANGPFTAIASSDTRARRRLSFSASSPAIRTSLLSAHADSSKLTTSRHCIQYRYARKEMTSGKSRRRKRVHTSCWTFKGTLPVGAMLLAFHCSISTSQQNIFTPDTGFSIARPPLYLPWAWLPTVTKADLVPESIWMSAKTLAPSSSW